MAGGEDGIGVRFWPIDQSGGSHNVAKSDCFQALRTKDLIPISSPNWIFGAMTWAESFVWLVNPVKWDETSLLKVLRTAEKSPP